MVNNLQVLCLQRHSAPALLAVLAGYPVVPICVEVLTQDFILAHGRVSTASQRCLCNAAFLSTATVTFVEGSC